jgi:hypothetical protein
VSGAARAAALVAVLAGAAPARAYVRTTDTRTGAQLSWPVPAVPWHLNRDWPDSSPSCQATAAGDPTLDAVRLSFDQWEQGCSDLRFLYAGELPEIRTGAAGTGENLVVFRRGWCSQDPRASVDPCMSDPEADCGSIYGCFDDGPACIGKNPCPNWGIVALTSVLYDPSTGRIMDADIEVAGWDGVGAPTTTTPPVAIRNPPQHGWYFTCYPQQDQTTLTPCATYGQGGCAYMDLQNTVTHEVGHVLGLAHSSVTGATMNATTAPRETDKRSLAADDIQGVCAIYPPPSGGCGCGGGEPAGVTSLLLVALALRPRRPRR